MGEDEKVMPWGKYKETYIHKLPSDYLKWLAENCDWDDEICTLADEEWQYRERYNTHQYD